jgi:hypothetical protein
MPGPFAERNREICRLREEFGWSFTRLAKRYGISATNVRDTYLKTRGINFEQWPVLRKLLPTRVQNVLLHKFNHDESIFENPERILKETCAWELLCLKNMGKQSVIDLASVLWQVGYPPPEDWYRSAPPGTHSFGNLAPLRRKVESLNAR